MPDKLILTTSAAREVRIVRMFDAPRALVFDAFTKPELIRQWLLGPPGWTMPVCEVDLRVGGKYRYVWRSADGTDMGMGGVHREVIVPEVVVATQLFDEDWTGGETLGTNAFSEKDGRTTLTQTIVYSSDAARAAALRTGMTEGMEMGYQRLDAMLPGLG